MDKKTKHMHNAAKLLRQQHSGVLSTISASQNGFPFGSVTPFLMTETGDIVIYASDIAQHSRNMKKDKRVSLCVYDGMLEDSQASARVTIIATAQADEVDKTLQAQYMKVFPQAKEYVKAHDFRFYYLSTTRVRYIGGFGEIYWFDSQEWANLMNPIAKAASAAIEHMHEDHADALSLIANKTLNARSSENEVTMLTCFQHGFHVEVNARPHKPFIDFIPFVKPISDDYHLRLAMVDLTNNAKELDKKLTSII